MQAWILVGMMGAGKSTVGKLLADSSQRRFLDTDKLIEKRLGRPITQIFRLYGEEAFRDHETSIIQELMAEATVVATGGGAVVRDQNWDHLRKIGRVVYLRSDPNELIYRLQTSKKKRPLLHSEDWEDRIRDILQQRRERYESADVIVDVDQLEQIEVVSKIMQELEIE